MPLLHKKPEQLAGMNLSVQAIFSLKLMSCTNVVSSNNALSFLKASRILRNVLHQVYEDCKNIDSAEYKVCAPQSVPAYMCTWRPRFCLDIFLYFPKNNNVIIGMPMYGALDRDENIEIQYFETETLVSCELENVYFFGHLTCDRQEDGSIAMVILLYDMMLEDENSHHTVTERYGRLQMMRETLDEISIGDACVRVQWAGLPEACYKINELSLPHDTENIILFGHDHSYHKFQLESPCES